VYQDVAMLAAAFSVSGSKWNQSPDADTAVLRVKETLEYDLKPSEIHEVRWAGCSALMPRLKLGRTCRLADGLAHCSVRE
jgi:hypothetical protein